MDLLKVLASDSRRDILRHLDRRRMTLSELSAALGLKKATVLEHLRKLTDAGLIRRLEDERLWVYYELTHRGGRLVNPGRTRFFLVLGLASAAALVLLGAAAFALTLAGPSDTGASGVGAGGLHAEVAWTSDGLVAGAPLRLRASALAGQDVAEVERALLMTPADAGALRAGRLQGIPLVPVPAEGGGVELVSRGPVPAGDYYLYVADAQGRDNADALRSVRVPALAAAGPSILWRGLDESARFELRRDEAPANGTFLLAASTASSRAAGAARVEEGNATFDAAAIDALAPGAFTFEFLAEGAEDPAPLPGRVEVRDARAVVAPLDLAQGSDGVVTVTLAPSSDLAPGDVRVLVDGEPAAAARVAPHVLRLRLDASEPGERLVQVGRLAPQAVTIHPDLRLDLAREDDRAYRLVARSALGEAVPNVTLRVGNATAGATDANGTLLVPPLAEGRHVLAFRHHAAGEDAVHVVESDGANLSLVPRALALSVDATTVGDLDVSLRVRLDDAWPVETPVVVAARLGGEIVALQRVDSGGANGTRTLPLTLARPAAGTHDLRVQAFPGMAAPLTIEGRAPTWGGATDNRTPTTMPPPTTTTPTGDATTGAERSYAPDVNGSASPDRPYVAFYRLAADEVIVPLRVESLVPPTTPPTIAPTGHRGAMAATPEVPGPGLLLVAAALAAAAAIVARRRGGRGA